MIMMIMMWCDIKQA